MSPWFAALSVYRNPRILLVLMLGFASGLPLALTGQTLAVRLTEDGLSLGSIGLFAAVGTPYALKFIWAPLIDRMPLPLLTHRLGRRRGWLVAMQVALALATLALGLAQPREALALVAILALLVAFASASQDIVIDALRVEMLEERELAAGAAAIVFGYRIGMLVSGAGALYLASIAPWHLVYAVMAALLGIGLAAAWLAPEPKPRPNADGEARLAAAKAWVAARQGAGGGSSSLAHGLAYLYVSVVGPFAQFMSRPGWVAVLLFAMLFKLGDSLAGTMTTPFFLKLGFSKIDIANVAKVYGFAATMIGLFIGGWLMNAVGLVRALWLCGILQLVSNLAFALQAEVGDSLAMLAFTVGFENLTGGMGTAALVAYLSSLCNVSYTATQYALLSALTAVARTWLSASAGYFAEMLGWASFFAMTALAALPGLALLWWLTRAGALTRPEGQVPAPAGLTDD